MNYRKPSSESFRGVSPTALGNTGDISQRQHARVAYNGIVLLTVNERSAPRLAADLSLGGMFIATSTPPRAGTKITLTLAIPGDLPMEVDARVRWIDCKGGAPRGCGVQFEPLDGVQLDQLVRLMAYASEMNQVMRAS